MVKLRRWWIQLTSTLVSNSYLKGFLEGRIYKGKFKMVCSPGMNCYSCPGAVSSCPIGALQAVFGSVKYWYSLYVVGFIGLLGLFLGRWICGFLCPFGWLQEGLYKIKSKKLKVAKGLTKIKYLLLVVFVLIIPATVTNIIGLGDPVYCKYICPVGMLEGGLPLVFMNEALQQAIGWLYYWKLTILSGVLIGSVFFYRPFCKVMCPLGAFYALFNKVSFYQYRVEGAKCIECQACSRVCKMDVEMYKTPNHTECIRCGECKDVCPTSAITSGFNVDKVKSL